MRVDHGVGHAAPTCGDQARENKNDEGRGRRKSQFLTVCFKKKKEEKEREVGLPASNGASLRVALVSYTLYFFEGCN